MNKKVYRITESQMRKILMSKKVSDNKSDQMDMNEYGNYPAGSANDPNAPWNDGGTYSKSGEYVRGNFIGVGYDADEMILMDKSNNKYYLTYNDAMEEEGEDIYELLSDYLDIPQEEDEDEDGRYMVAVDDWKSYIDQHDLLEALASYLNFLNKKGLDIESSTDLDKFESGDSKLLELTPETIESVSSDRLKSKVKF